MQDFQGDEEIDASEQRASNSPVVGEKRLREEDDTGEQERRDNANPHQIKTDIDSTMTTQLSSHPAGTNGHMAPVINGGMGAGHGFDALYIGDLQWVCLFIRLVLPCPSRSEIPLHVFCLPFLTVDD